MDGIDLSQRWSEAPMWLKLWFVLGAIALVGGISWDRVTMQQKADAFGAGFGAQCAALEVAHGDPERVCGCLLESITEEYGTGRRLARQSAYWDAATLGEMATAAGCDGPRAPPRAP